MNEAMGKIRDYIALIMTVAVIGLVAFKIPIVDRFWDVYLMVISFFFGSKTVDAPKDTTTTTTSTTSPTEVKP